MNQIRILILEDEPTGSKTHVEIKFPDGLGDVSALVDAVQKAAAERWNVVTAERRL